MSAISLGTVIAERELHSATAEKQVRIRIGRPQKTKHEDFITPYQISGVGDEKIRYAAGFDAVQSLQLVFRMIGADIACLKDLKLTWADRDDAGFPVL